MEELGLPLGTPERSFNFDLRSKSFQKKNGLENCNHSTLKSSKSRALDDSFVTLSNYMDNALDVSRNNPGNESFQILLNRSYSASRQQSKSPLKNMSSLPIGNVIRKRQPKLTIELDRSEGSRENSEDLRKRQTP